MWKFFIASDKQIAVSGVKNLKPRTVNIYMVRDAEKAYKFNEDLDDAMWNLFETLTIVKHNRGYWYNIEIDELIHGFDIPMIERYFELPDGQFII